MLKAGAPDAEFRMLAQRVSSDELEERREKARAKAAERGLDGLLIWARGGPAVDNYANLLYLTNHYAPVASEPDNEDWTGRSYSALILPVEGEPILVIDIPEYPEEIVDVEDVRAAMHVPLGVAEALRDAGISEGRIGLVGQSIFLAHHERAIFEALERRIEWDPAEGILEELRAVKSETEIQLMREAAEVGVGWMTTIMEAAVPGVTEGAVAGKGLSFLFEHGGLPQDLDIASGPFKHRLKSHSTIPSWDIERKLEAGDNFHVDAWGSVGGYFTDMARATVVGGKASAEQKRVMNGAVDLIEHLIEGIRPGILASDINKRAQLWLSENGFGSMLPGSDEDQVWYHTWPYFGHGLGLGIEAPWLTDANETEIVPNMVLAIEVIVSSAEAGWAGFEDNIVVREGEPPENLTSALRSRWWD